MDSRKLKQKTNMLRTQTISSLAVFVLEKRREIIESRFTIDDLQGSLITSFVIDDFVKKLKSLKGGELEDRELNTLITNIISTCLYLVLSIRTQRIVFKNPLGETICKKVITDISLFRGNGGD